MPAVAPAVHPLQHGIADVLQGNIQIGNQLFPFLQGIQQLRVNGIRIGIQYPNPVQAVYTIQLFEQGNQTGLPI